MPKFRRKPVEVTAEQFWPDRLPWPAGVRQAVVTGSMYGRDDGQPDGWRIDDPVYDHRVRPGDWIVTSEGVRRPVPDKSFRANYTLIDEPEPPQKPVDTWWAGPDDEAVA